MAKKNLFKMWGSWIGAGVYVLSFVLAWLLQPKPLLTTSAYYHIVFPILRFPFGLFVSSGSSSFPMPDFSSIWIFPANLIFYLLLGWGIERLARKNKWFGLR